MSLHSMHTLGRIFGLFLILAAAPALAQTQPTLFTLSAGTPTVLGQGVQKSWPIKVNEDQAFDAIFKGGMWLPNPAGGRIYAKYKRHILHDNGTWTWIGTVSSVHGDQSVVLTFGKDGVFGLVPQASGYPLRIMTRKGQTTLVETSAQAMAKSAKALRLYSKPDYVIPPRVALKGKSTAAATESAASTAMQSAAASGSVTIDVMVAYTPGFVTELGSQSLALTRIQNLVDITNTAYVTSGVNQQIRLVNTVQVNYPDNTDDQSALDDITGIDENGNPVTIPAALQGIAALRVQYGADLVTLMRSFDDTTQNGCGVGWLIGGNQTAITQQSNVYGYNVVSDGTSNNSSGQPVYCLETTFAHELGHNMGDAHDRANASESGAYPYSYGYQGNGVNGFSTIMAYGTATTTPLAVFSNPNISTCQNTPCGVADTASNSADNAHSMNNTAVAIASFEPTMIGTTPPSTYVHNDVDGDGKSDLIWRSTNGSQFAYWLMNGTQLTASFAIPTSTTYKFVATGDFNGDGKMDAIWTDGTSMYMWIGNGSSFTSVYMGGFPTGWTVVGAGDLNGDGSTDLVWANSNQVAEWLMSGSTMMASYRQTLASGWRYLGMGDFDGDGKADLLLTNGSAMQMWTAFSSGAFQAVATHAYPAGWTLLGTGDVNGDHKADLLWRDNSQTHFAYWIMSSTQLVKSWLVAVTPEWKFGTSGDFNGDGLLDLVWYNGSQLVMWPGSSTGVYKGVYFHSYPTGGWTMLP
ncbi:MAG: FG-GAP-like repeat-containing protein [Pseudomonadota bacterium]